MQVVPSKWTRCCVAAAFAMFVGAGPGCGGYTPPEKEIPPPPQKADLKDMQSSGDAPAKN